MIDLSQVPAPAVIEELNFETLLAERKAELIAAMPADMQADITATLALESEPLTILLEDNVYRELALRAHVNDSAKATMLAYATGTDLDQRGANLGVLRLTLVEADIEAVPPVPAVREADDDFRARILLSLESYTTAGSTDSYRYHALSASAQVLDARIVSPAPGQVLVYVLSREGDGVASDELLAAVASALNAFKVRPLTDQVTVLSASIVHYTIEAAIYVSNGSSPETVREQAGAAGQAYANATRLLGMGPSISGIHRALTSPGRCA